MYLVAELLKKHADLSEASSSPLETIRYICYVYSITVYSARVGIVYLTTFTLIKVQLSSRVSLGARTKLLD